MELGALNRHGPKRPTTLPATSATRTGSPRAPLARQGAKKGEGIRAFDTPKEPKKSRETEIPTGASASDAKEAYDFLVKGGARATELGRQALADETDTVKSNKVGPNECELLTRDDSSIPTKRPKDVPGGGMKRANSIADIQMGTNANNDSDEYGDGYGKDGPDQRGLTWQNATNDIPQDSDSDDVVLPLLLN